jgi:hypothetical protein
MEAVGTQTIKFSRHSLTTTRLYTLLWFNVTSVGSSYFPLITRLIGHARAFDNILWVVVLLRLVLARPFLKLHTQLDINSGSTTPKRDWRAPYRLSVTLVSCINGLAI